MTLFIPKGKLSRILKCYLSNVSFVSTKIFKELLILGDPLISLCVT